MNYEDDEEIKLLRLYLRIPCGHPNVDYEKCIKLFQSQADALHLQFRVFYASKADRPIIILTWPGLQPNLPAIMLNSHMDAASVLSDKWIYLPFAAHMDENGMIYGRGIQSKSVGIQYLAAIRALKRQGFQGHRTLYITFMPDEENCGRGGMRPFVTTNVFRQMNIGFAINRGVPSPENYYSVFYAERTMCQLAIKITGASENPFFLSKATAGEKFTFILKKFQNLREKESQRLRKNNKLTLGDVTTINLTLCNSNDGANDLPTIIDACFDIRLDGNVQPDQFVNQLHQWCKEAGGGIDIIVFDSDFIKATTVLEESNPFWKTFKQVCAEENVTVMSAVLPEASDSRFLRQVNAPTINFSPIPNTPNLAYADNEYLNASTFLQGIEFYKKLIPSLLNTPEKIKQRL